MKFTLNFRYIIKIYGYIILTVGLAMLPATITAYAYRELEIGQGFFLSCMIVVPLGLACIYFSKPRKTLLKVRDGFFIVGLAWVIVSLLGSLPYLLSGYTDSFFSAFFESTAGFTTTGATVFDVERTPRGLLMWKAISHWLGGMGILVFMVGLMSTLGAGGQKIFQAEFPALGTDKLTSRISDSAKLLYLIYIVLTVAEFALLSFSGKMDIFDNLVTTLGCVSTSGLFAHHEGIAYFDSVYIESVITVFTILSSISYPLYHLIVKGRFKEVTRNAEVRTYITILVSAALAVTASLYFTGTYDTVGESLRYASFYTAAFATTSGYSLVDYSSWPSACLAIFLILMLIGGCSSSTSGGAKVARIMVMFKLMYQTLYKRLHPNAVVGVRISKELVPAQVVSNVTSFMLSFFALLLCGSLVLSLQGYGFITNISAALAMMSNTGIYLSDLASAGYFGIYSPPLQFVLTLLMLIGRLEIFSLLIIFSSSFWHPDRGID